MAGSGFSGGASRRIQPPSRGFPAPPVLCRGRLGLVPASLQSALASVADYPAGGVYPDAATVGGRRDAAFPDAMGAYAHELVRGRCPGSSGYGAAFSPLRDLGPFTAP